MHARKSLWCTVLQNCKVSFYKKMCSIYYLEIDFFEFWPRSALAWKICYGVTFTLFFDLFLVIFDINFPLMRTCEQCYSMAIKKSSYEDDVSITTNSFLVFRGKLLKQDTRIHTVSHKMIRTANPWSVRGLISTISISANFFSWPQHLISANFLLISANSN